MARYLTLETRRKSDGLEQTRLFELSERQVDLIDETTTLLASHLQQRTYPCFKLVQGVACRLLLGGMPSEDAPNLLFRLRFEFPTLTKDEIEALPVAGCPDGKIEAVVIQAKIGNITKTFLLEFDKAQEEFFNDGIEAFQNRNGLTRDEAWHQMMTIVARLSSGAQLKPDADDFMRFAAGVFPTIEQDQLAAMPEATLDDARRWSFR